MSTSADAAHVQPGNQRARVRMTDVEVDAYLQAHTGDVVLSTLHPDGTIHSVAMYYGFVDGRLGVLTKRKSQKARNVARDPRATFLVAIGTTYDQLRGVELAGEVEVTDERDLMLGLARSIRSRRHEPVDREALLATIHGRVALVARPTRIVSWDHSKLFQP